MIEPGLRKHMTDDAAIMALVGVRVFPQVNPAGGQRGIKGDIKTPLPAITYDKTGETPRFLLNCDEGDNEAVYTVRGWAEDHKGMKALECALRGMIPQRGFQGYWDASCGGQIFVQRASWAGGFFDGFTAPEFNDDVRAFVTTGSLTVWVDQLNTAP